MKKTRKTLNAFILGFMLIMIATGITGCGKATSIEKNFAAKEVSSIDIETALNEVIVRETDGEQLMLRIEGQENEDFYDVKDGVLTIKIGGDDGGFKISLSNKEHKPLYLDVPAGMLESLSIKTSMGSVQVDGVDIPNLDVYAEMGSITITGMEGAVEATAVTGKIESDLSISSDIKKGEIGTSFIGEIGENSGYKITVKTDMGNIKFE